MRTQPRYLVNKQQYYQQFRESEFWLAALTQVVDEILPQLDAGILPETCLADLTNLQDTVFARLLHPTDYIDVVLSLFAEVSRRQFANEYIQLPGFQATAESHQYHYYLRVSSYLRDFLQSFMREYAQWLPAARVHQALLKNQSVEHMQLIINHLESIPQIYAREINLQAWHTEFKRLVATHVTNQQLKKFLLTTIATWANNFTYLTEQPKELIEEENYTKKFDVSPIIKTLGTVALISQQFTAAAAADTNDKHNIVEVNRALPKDEPSHLILMAADMGLAVTRNYLVNVANITFPDTDSLKQRIQKSIDDTVSLNTNGYLEQLNQDIYPLTDTDLHRFLKQIMNSNSVSGFMPKARMLFKHYQLHDERKLSEDNYLFAKEAAQIPFNASTIPAVLRNQLIADLRFEQRAKHDLLSALAKFDDVALFRVAFAYAMGNDMVNKNLDHAVRWAQLAMQRGNLWAAVFIYEQISQSGWHPKALSCLHFAALHGHSYASFELGRLYKEGKVVRADSQLAQGYFLQAYLQFPASLHALHAALETTYQRIEAEFPEKKVPAFSFANFEASLYPDLHKAIREDSVLLKALIVSEQMITNTRAAVEYMTAKQGYNPLLAQSHQHFFIRMRKAQQHANDLLQRLSFDFDGIPHTLPTVETIESFGIQCLPWSVAATPGYIEELVTAPLTDKTKVDLRELAGKGCALASYRIADGYASGKGLPKNIILAEYFYRQAIKQQLPKPQLQQIYQKLKEISHVRVSKLARVTIQSFYGDLFYDEIQKNLQLNKATLKAMGYQLIARPTLPRRDSSANHFSGFFSDEAIENGNMIPDDLLASLAQDIKIVDKDIQSELQASYSALLDGDYQYMAIVAHSYYQIDAAKCLRWNLLAAEHGNALGMYMVGKIYAEGLSVGKTKVERNVPLSVHYMARAASAGLGIASHAMISSMRFDSRYVNLFIDQAMKQDPQFADSANFLFPNRSHVQLAVDTRGVAPLRVDSSNLAWYRVSRVQQAVTDLWGAFKGHHPDQDYTEKLYVGFLSGDTTCYLTIAKWYDTTQVEMSVYTRETFAYIWAMLGYRDGDLAACAYFAEKTYLQYDKNFNVPIYGMLIVTDTFFRLKEQLQEPVNTNQYSVTSLGTMFARLGVHALYYAAYHGDYASSELLADNSHRHPWLQDTAKPHFRRVLYAQAIHQGSLRPITYTHFLSVTTTLMDAVSAQVREISCRNPDMLLTSAVQVEIYARGMQDVCDYIDACLLERQIAVDPADSKRQDSYKEYLNDNLHQRQRLQLRQSLEVSLSKFKSHGLRVSLGYQHYHTSDKMMRPRAQWEWRDVIPELVDSSFTIEQQPRAQTLEVLQRYHEAIITKLKNHYLTDPEEMLALRAFLIEEGFTELAQAWLEHAAHTGDKIANRILGMMTHNYDLIALASAYGDPVALACLLNRTDISENIRIMLQMQAKQTVTSTGNHERTLHANGHVVVPRPSIFSSSTIFNIGSMLMASAGALLYNLVKSKRQQTERDAMVKFLPAITKQLADIRQQLALLKYFPQVETLLIDEKHCFELRLLPWPVQAMPKAAYVRALSITPAEFAANKGMLKLVTHSLQHIHGIQIDERQLLSALGLQYRANNQLLSYCHQRIINQFSLTSAEHLSLLQAYLKLNGFNAIEVITNPIGETILHVNIPSNWECTPWQIFMAKLLLTVSLRISHDVYTAKQEGMQQERDLQKSITAARHYLQQVDVLDKRTVIIALHKELDSKYQFIVKHCHDKREMDLMVRSAKNCLLNCDDALALVCQIPKQLEQPANVDLIAFVEKFKKALQKIARDDADIHKLEQLYHRLHKAHAKAQLKNHVAVLPVVAAPAPQVIAVEEVAVVAVVPATAKPAKEKCDYPDIHDIDFSQCQVVTPKVKVSEEGQFGARNKTKKSLKYKGWLKREMATRINGMNVLLENNVFQLERLQSMHFYALHYRFLRLHLLINLLNRADNAEIPADNLLRNKVMDDFSNNMVNGLMHNYFRVKREDLIQCVNECYRDKAIYSKTCDAVKATDLYRLICPAEGEQLVVLRNNTELLEDLNYVLTELLELFKTSQEKFDDPLLYPGYLDACRMLLMVIGEICQRLDFADCDLHLEFQPILSFLHDCRLIVRNPDKHKEDVRARFEAAILHITFVVENYTIEDLKKLVSRGIDLFTKNNVLLSQFTQYLIDKDRQLVYK